MHRSPNSFNIKHALEKPPVPPTNDTTPRQGNARHPNAQDGSTPIMKTRFLPRELSLGRGPGGLGGGLSSTSMRGDMSLGLESSMVREIDHKLKFNSPLF